jgi:formylglycine-generating enzyme required for sulfatase activity
VETVREVGDKTHMVLRGAPFHPRLGPLRTAYRYWHQTTDRFSTVGLRVARTRR